MPFAVTTLISRLLDLAGSGPQANTSQSIISSFVYDDYVTTSGNKEVGVLIKPLAKRLINALMDSTSKEMYGLLHGGEMIWWEPSDIDNADIVTSYGYADVASNYFHARLDGTQVRLEYDEVFWNYPSLKRRLQLRQLMECADFYFHVENLGWVSGPEWMEMHEDDLGTQWMNVQRTKPSANIIASKPAKTPANRESEARDTNMTPLSLLIAMRS